MTFDTQVPVVSITSPANGTITNQSEIAVAWTVDGVAQTTELAASLTEGENTITRSYTDAAGNTGSHSINITFGITVPEVVGLNWEQASNLLNQVGLIIDNRNWVYNDAEEGIVIEQSLSAGTVVMVGSPVDIVLSLGTPLVDLVPVQIDTTEIISVAPKLVLSGTPLVYIVNQGSAPCYFSYKVELYKDSDNDGLITTSDTKIGSSSVFGPHYAGDTVTIPVTLYDLIAHEPGERIGVVVDPASEITEENETNNTFSTVLSLNRPPVFNSIPITLFDVKPAGTIDNVYLYYANAIDPDGDEITYELLERPDGMSINSAGRVLWEPSVEDTGVQQVTISASDTHGGISEQVYELKITSGNRKPVVLSNPPTVCIVGEELSYQIEALDPDSTPDKPFLCLGTGQNINATVMPGTKIGTYLFDVSNPYSPENMDFIDLEEVVGTGASPFQIVVDNNYIYETFGMSNTASSAKAGFVILRKTPGMLYNDTDAVTGTTGKLELLSSTAQNTNYFSVAVKGNYAYLGKQRGAVHVYDIHDKSNPQFVNSVPEQGISGHEIWHLTIYGNYLYAAYDNWGFAIFDISDPLRPEMVGLRKDGSYARCVFIDSTTYPLAYVSYIYSGSGELCIYDVSNPEEIQLVKKLNCAGNSHGTSVYATHDRAYVLTADVPLGMQIFDVTNILQPQSIGFWPVDANGWGDVIVDDDFAYISLGDQASKAVPGGLRIVNISDPANPELASSFPVYGNAAYTGQKMNLRGDRLTYTLIDAPDDMRIDERDGLLSWTPQYSDAGTKNILVRIWDIDGVFFDHYFDLIVTNPPTFTSSPEQQALTGYDYIYDCDATDLDGDAISYSLVQAPENMSIDMETGVTTWFAENCGDYTIQIKATDASGVGTTQRFTLTVIEPAGLPPQIVSTPTVSTQQGQIYVYTPIAEDPDNDVLNYRLVSGPDGMVMDETGNITWLPGASMVGVYTVLIEVTDGTYSVSQEFSINVFNVNDPPSITSMPSTVAITGALYEYQIFATDPDNDEISFTLVDAPEGMAIDNSGYISWSDNGSRAANSYVKIKVSDGNGGYAAQEWHITLSGDNIQPVVKIEFSKNPVVPYTPVVIQAHATDNVGLGSVKLFVKNIEVLLDEQYRYTFAPEEIGTVPVTVKCFDVNSNYTEATSNLMVVHEFDNEKPVVSITGSTLTPHVGETVTFNVSASDNDEIDEERIWVESDNQKIRCHNTTAEYVFKRKGEYIVTAVVYDKSGNADYATLPLSVTWSGVDVEQPVISICSPQTDTVISGTVEIIGSISDENFAYYTVSYRALDNATFVEYFRSDEVVQNGSVAALDGTKLSNGIYEFKVTAYDKKSNVSTASVNVCITGNKKIGMFTMAFEDLQIPLPGINLGVTRAYDSRDKTPGDFGYGWKLGLRSITIYESGKQGEGWEVEDVAGGFLPDYILQTDEKHKIVISIPGGRDQVFIPKPLFYNRFDTDYGYMTYVAAHGTYSTLEALDATDFVRLGEELYDLYGEFNETFNPQRYRLTLIDGTSYVLNQNTGGLERMTDPNGNFVNLSATKIIHSTGKQFSFNRDEQNRITSISDGTGRTVSYMYDLTGNLAKVTDLNGNTTRFKYTPDHYLTEIIDPRGVRVVRTEYDDDDRMVQQINAEGDTIRFDHDIENNREVTTGFNGVETEYTYDDHGNVTQKKDHLGNIWHYTYDELDNVISTRNPENHTTFSEFDARGNEVSSTDALNRITTRAFNERNQITSETDALNRTTRYSYDSRGNLLSVTGPDGIITEQKTYDSFGNVLAQTDALGNQTRYQYDESGRLTSQFDQFGRKTEYRLDSRGNTTMQIGTTGDTTRYLYDAMDNQIMSINAINDTVKTTYNVFNKTASQTDALGNVAVFEYDMFGQLSRTIAPDGTAVRKQYDSQGNVSHSIDEVGRVTQFEYDHENRIVRIIANDGSSTRVEYDAVGRRTASIDANGNRTEYEYDAVGNNTLVRDASGNVTHYEYDAANRRTAMIDALNHRTEYGYDDYDRLIRTTFDDGTFGITSYDLAGRKTAETDPEGKTTAFAYDSVGNLKSVTDAMGHVTRYTYDAHNNRIGQTDANNHTTTMQYDKLNRLVQRTYPNNDIERFGYDENGNQIYKVDGNGDSTVYTYDNRNREVLKRFTNSGHTVETRYTDDGKPDTIIDHRGMTVYTYDNRGRQAAVVNPDNTFIESEYDNNGNRTEQRTPFDTVTYTYDALNRMSQVRTLRSLEGSVTEYFYNEVGNRDSVHNASGTSTGYEYDDLNRLTKVTNFAPDQTIISSYEYELNNAGIRTSVTESDPSTPLGAGGSRVDYAYDDCYKLTGETRTGNYAYSITFTYDNIGNRLTQVRDGVTKSYTYNNRDQLTQEDSAGVIAVYSYDPAGRMLSKTIAGNTTIYGWQDNDRMVSVTGSGVSVTYNYDHNEQRVSEISATGTTHYLIDYQLPYGQVVADFDENGDILASYAYGLERISMDRNGTTFTYVADGQGSTRNLTNSSGNITDTYYYTAFGEQLAKTGTTENRFMYVGEQWDSNAWFYYNRARWMDPSTGRFISVDPWNGDPQAPVSLHRYLYANVSPIAFVDPSGKFSVLELMVTVGVIGILSAVVIPTYHMDDFVPNGKITNLITIKRIHIHPFSDDQYGHWWIELAVGESYGWWPMYPFSGSFMAVIRTITGVEGELNGQTSFGGTLTRDPHHGEIAEEEFHPRVKENKHYRNIADVYNAIRTFANSYTGTYSWPIGQNCHSFQIELMEKVGLTKP